jgi:hypothetical protein
LDDMHSLQIVKELAPYAFGIGAGYWVKKWIGRTDENIQKLVDSVQSINVQLAVNHENRLVRDEILHDLKKRMDENEKDLGALKGSVKTFWGMMKGKSCDDPIKSRQ